MGWQLAKSEGKFITFYVQYKNGKVMEIITNHNRIFYLKGIESGGAKPFSEVQNHLKDLIIEKEIGKEQTAYLERLHTAVWVLGQFCWARTGFRVNQPINNRIPQAFRVGLR